MSVSVFNVGSNDGIARHQAAWCLVEVKEDTGGGAVLVEEHGGVDGVLMTGVRSAPEGSVQRGVNCKIL